MPLRFVILLLVAIATASQAQTYTQAISIPANGNTTINDTIQASGDGSSGSPHAIIEIIDSSGNQIAHADIYGLSASSYSASIGSFSVSAAGSQTYNVSWVVSLAPGNYSVYLFDGITTRSGNTLNWNPPGSPGYSIVIPTLTLPDMIPPTSVDASITAGAIWKPTYAGGDSGLRQIFVVAGATPWQFSSWSAIPGTWQFYVGEMNPNDGTYNSGPNNLSPQGAPDNLSGNASAFNGPYTLTVNPIAQSVAISPSSATILAGQSVAFTGTGSSTGYVFRGSASGSSNPTTINFPSAGTYTITVYAPAGGNYAQSNTATSTITVVSTYTLSVNAGSGGSASGSASGLLGSDNPSISAAPNSGYYFTGWSGDSVANAGATTTTVPMNNGDR
ncbi:MAG TPA: hypothetical protein VKC60_14125, partial [Opitutaceae bacterium]|nr:hypothetical protein [Opitutaceae bacterium]